MLRLAAAVALKRARAAGARAAAPRLLSSKPPSESDLRALPALDGEGDGADARVAAAAAPLDSADQTVDEEGFLALPEGIWDGIEGELERLSRPDDLTFQLPELAGTTTFATGEPTFVIDVPEAHARHVSHLLSPQERAELSGAGAAAAGAEAEAEAEEPVEIDPELEFRGGVAVAEGMFAGTSAAERERLVLLSGVLPGEEGLSPAERAKRERLRAFFDEVLDTDELSEFGLDEVEGGEVGELSAADLADLDVGLGAYSRSRLSMAAVESSLMEELGVEGHGISPGEELARWRATGVAPPNPTAGLWQHGEGLRAAAEAGLDPAEVVAADRAFLDGELAEPVVLPGEFEFALDPHQPGRAAAARLAAAGDRFAADLDAEGEGGDSDTVEQENTDETGVEGLEEQYYTALIGRKNVQHTEPGGRISSTLVCVVAGNMDGAAGYAFAKSADPNNAIAKATRKAVENMTTIDRFEDRTLFHEVRGKKNGCVAILRPGRFGAGMTGSEIASTVADAFGLDDLRVKMLGRHKNPFIAVQAIFDALQDHETPAQRARRLGKREIPLRQTHDKALKLYKDLAMVRGAAEGEKYEWDAAGRAVLRGEF